MGQLGHGGERNFVRLFYMAKAQLKRKLFEEQFCELRFTLRGAAEPYCTLTSDKEGAGLPQPLPWGGDETREGFQA